MLRYIRYIFYLLVLAACSLGCSREALQLYEPSSDGEIRPGEEIMFTSYLPENPSTKTAQEDFQAEIKKSYKAVNRDYSFTVTMFESQNPETVIGSSTYTPSMSGEDEFAGDGTLELSSGATALLWPDNVKKYGFKVSSGSETLSQFQSLESELIAQDRLEGVSYSPVWVGDPDTGYNPDKVDFVNFRSSKEWYASNKSVFEQYGQMATSSAEYKKVPLFLQHKRAMITVVLKADEGVGRDQLHYDIARNTIESSIASYGDGEKKIRPFAEPATIDYGSEDYGGEASGVGTIQYSAVVEPFNYLEVAEDKPICTINLSGQKFTYYASNDAEYNQYLAEKSNPQSDAAKRVANAYDLKAGQHLTLVVTLSRESRKIVITAYVEDWKERITNTICDDYGLNGDPEKIRNRAELLAFLNSSKNKSGAVAIITPTALDLEMDTVLDKDGKVISSTPAPWPASGLKLNCMLNLAGSVIYTEHRFLDEISSSGNLVNGTVVVRSGKTLDAVVADANKGTVENVNVMPEKDQSGTLLPSAIVTRAGIVVKNSGTIFSCSSSIPVNGTGDFIGGIAAQSLRLDASSKSPFITDCVMTAKVTGNDSVIAAGGIVGSAEGLVSGNTFEYGITVLQDEFRFMNIVGQIPSGSTLTAERNSWPTTVANAAAGTNVSLARYTGVIESQAELEKVLTSVVYNNRNSRILIVDDFTVTNDWTYGKQDVTLDSSNNGNVLFELEGNNKTITLAGGDRKVTVEGVEYTTSSMLFTNIQNDIQNLTIVLEESLISQPSSSKDGSEQVVLDGLDAIAPLGYSVYGATLSNIRVKADSDKYIQSAMPAGIVAWAYGNAKLDRCAFKGDVKVWVPSTIGSSDLRFAGGIVALAETATFTQCYYPSGAITVNNEDKSIYCGGILGGISRRNNDSGVTPLVSIKDCASRYDVQTASQYKGVVVGASFYLNGSSSGEQRADGLDHTEAGKCEGNWWNASQRAIGTTYNGMSDVKALGPRNSIEPVMEDF